MDNGNLRLHLTRLKMKKLVLASFVLIFISWGKNVETSAIRINQLGYRPADVKTAVFISTDNISLDHFDIVDAKSGDLVKSFRNPVKTVPLDQFVSCYRLSFTEVKTEGTYRIVAGKTSSPAFRIGPDVYKGTADYLLNYMRQQRCGFNPWLKDSCHMQDGYEIYGKGDSAHIDVTGGWHDAADYLQYVATSANAVYQMLYAYSENRASFGDSFLGNGLPGPDGTADVLNEINWGLEWLLKMNPGKGVMYNQIADDRDHIGFRYPTGDTANYGKGRERPVYLCTGKPQGLYKYLNRATGIASTAGKFVSAFARAGEVFKTSEPEYSGLLIQKAREAFEYGLANPGACQTAPCRAPYFYEEDNWTDDMELAAIELYNATGEQRYLDKAVEFGKKEPVTPWMGSDTARHYQWYPFVNMGHPGISKAKFVKDRTFMAYMKRGLDTVRIRAEKNPFYVGVPFIWCSNNLVTAFITQAHLYAEISGDNSYAELEAAHRDWLFGCNPWGTSMVVGLPENGDYPVNSHSSYVAKGRQVFGGLVDGPVYSSIFRAHAKYVGLTHGDPYAAFQTRLANYHDDIGDYTSNECTMDGTACLIYYLSEMENPGNQNSLTDHGAITRMDTTKKEVWLCFTAHDLNDGFDHIIPVLRRHTIKASFFLTGDFLRDKANRKTIERLKADGHYIGPHSDRHLLYCSWEKRDSLLVTRADFIQDLENNFEALRSFGLSMSSSSVFMPPYEWYNDSISEWSKSCGLRIVNISRGTINSQDWTYPRKDGAYFTSDSIMKNMVSFESRKGMNGYILLIHPGTDPRRKDKFYRRLDEVLSYLEKKNYRFRSFSEI